MIGSLPHTCIILRRYQKQKLSFLNGTAAFHIGASVTGWVSGATAIIDSVTGTTLAGSLILKDVVGTFQTGEPITDTDAPTPGSAETSGVASLNRDSTNEGDFYWTIDQKGIPCRFYNKSGALQTLQNGQFTQERQMIILPPTVTVNAKWYRIAKTGECGEIYKINYVKAPSSFGPLPDHYECELMEVL